MLILDVNELVPYIRTFNSASLMYFIGTIITVVVGILSRNAKWDLTLFITMFLVSILFSVRYVARRLIK